MKKYIILLCTILQFSANTTFTLYEQNTTEAILEDENGQQAQENRIVVDWEEFKNKFPDKAQQLKKEVTIWGKELADQGQKAADILKNKAKQAKEQLGQYWNKNIAIPWQKSNN